MQPKTIIIFSTCIVALSLFLIMVSVKEPDINDPLIQTITKQLKADGYEVSNISRTLLGRYHIDARSDKFEREIVVAPGAGTFLRDDISPLDQDNLAGKN